MDHQEIVLNNVQTNNLKKLDIRIPLNSYTVVTGVSGSGKSSLVFDTLYGEAYRRYAESLSSFARQYLKALPKPDIDQVDNLPAAIAVKQARSGQSNRSTVGTMTELIDVLRILFAHLSDIYCCGHLIRRETGETMAQHMYQVLESGTCMILAPLEEWRHLKAKELKEHLQAQGFTRAYIKSKVCRIEECSAKDLRAGFVIVDRVKTTDENFRRFADSAALALKLGRGKVKIVFDERELDFDSSLRCPSCDTAYTEPSLSLFNFNHPLGACEDCQGFGRVSVLDRDKVVPDKDKSLASEGVAAWNFGKHKGYYRTAIASGKKAGIDADKPFNAYTKADWDWLWHGDRSFGGVEAYFAWLDTKKYKAHYRIHAARFKTYVQCPRCQGHRLNAQAMHCLIDGRNIVELEQLTLSALRNWFEELKAFKAGALSRQQRLSLGVHEAIEEGLVRLTYLHKVGLSYLSLSRSAKTLSGGETQRINMARSLGNALTDTLFCLDEPSSGLHPRDSHNLLEVMRELKDQGNTVVVVEHERALIDGADYLLELGPQAGEFGGELVYAGKPKPEEGRLAHFPFSSWSPQLSTKFLKLKGAATHNLKGIDISIPENQLTVVCGVSGSGKTSLIQHTLYPMLAQHLGKQPQDDDQRGNCQARSLTPRSLIRTFADVVLVSQEGIGRSTRSNIATYLGVYDQVRKLFAATPLAQSRKLKPGYFSFNVAGGRCEHCKGLGQVEEDLSFLGEMLVTCPECNGRRFQQDALDIRYNDTTILDILKMTITEAKTFFFDHKPLAEVLDAVIAMGMGYLTLGQNTSSFSGGEAQRLKITKFLLEKSKDGARFFIFDEPTTGLSDADVQSLLEQLRYLIKLGHTVLVVEHHLGLIRSADWLLEIGPDAADAGGQLVFEGIPSDLKGKTTETARFLNQIRG